MTRVLDSHLHVWDPAALDYEWLAGRLADRHAAPEVEAAILGGADMEFVFVQAECRADQSLQEVDWVTALAGRIGIRAIVARAAVENGDAVRAELEELSARPLVVGVRRLLEPEPPGFATSTEFLAGACAVADRGFTFDACVSPAQLGDVVVLADSVPDLAIVLDHLGKPAVAGGATPWSHVNDSWREQFALVAERPNVSCKISGLPAQADAGWTPSQLIPFLDHALDTFGPDRLLFGSDWPVSEPPLRWLSTVTDWLDAQRDDVAPRVLSTNARRFYGITED